jgi:hypothetical protein
MWKENGKEMQRVGPSVVQASLRKPRKYLIKYKHYILQPQQVPSCLREMLGEYFWVNIIVKHTLRRVYLCVIFTYRYFHLKVQSWRISGNRPSRQNSLDLHNIRAYVWAESYCWVVFSLNGALHSGGPGLKHLPGDRPYWLRFFVVFLKYIQVNAGKVPAIRPRHLPSPSFKNNCY